MTPVHHRARPTPAATHLLKTISAYITAAVLIGAPALPRPAQAGDIPAFAVEASWPKPLPNNWILGQVGGITVDWQGNIWVIHRPRSLTDDEKGASLNPPRSKCCVSAPPVLEFDADGNLLRSWGGPGEGYEWVGREHGIEVDEKGFVWVGGNADNDNAILKFTLDGKFVMQIGKIAPGKGSNDTTQLGKPAETAIDKEANEIYVADGYGGLAELGGVVRALARRDLADLHHELAVEGEFEDRVVVVGIAADPHKALLVDLDAVLAPDPFIAFAGPAHERSRLPSASNSSTGGAETQHFERGGFSAAPFSSSVSERGRWITQIWPFAIDGDAADLAEDPVVGQRFWPGRIDREGRDIAGLRGERRRCNEHCSGEAGGDGLEKILAGAITHSAS